MDIYARKLTARRPVKQPEPKKQFRLVEKKVAEGPAPSATTGFVEDIVGIILIALFAGLAVWFNVGSISKLAVKMPASPSDDSVSATPVYADGVEQTEPEPKPDETQEATMRPGLWKVTIPSIGVGAQMDALGLKDGKIATPYSVWRLGWYGDSPKPGQPGTSFITGHYDLRPGYSAFSEINNLKIGDEINVKSRDGANYTYIVTTIENYKADKVPMDAILAPRNEAMLAIVTCNGKWLGDGFEDRLVVLPACPLKNVKIDTVY